MSTKISAYKIATTAMLGAVATILMILEFPIPFLVPPFIKMDLSELPALLATFSMGPISGVAVCFIKNLIHCIVSSSGYVGELCNFLLGCCLVVPAGLIYHRKKSRGSALLGSLVGTVIMALISIPANRFLTYPFYMATFHLTEDVLMGMYQDVINLTGSIFPVVKGLMPMTEHLITCLIVFNAPFTLLKGILTAALAFLIYKPLSPLLHK